MALELKIIFDEKYIASLKKTSSIQNQFMKRNTSLFHPSLGFQWPLSLLITATSRIHYLKEKAWNGKGLVFKNKTLCIWVVLCYIQFYMGVCDSIDIVFSKRKRNKKTCVCAFLATLVALHFTPVSKSLSQ